MDRYKKIAKYAGASFFTMQLFVLNARATSDPLAGLDWMTGDLIGWIQDVLNLVIGLAGLIAVGILVYSGIMYIVSAGDEAKVESATKGITYSIIGLVICFVSILIVNFVLEYVLESA